MWNKFNEWYAQNRGLFWGLVIGLAIAVLFLTIGFFPTLLIMVCMGIGAFLGTHPEVRAAIGNFFSNLFASRDRS